MEVNRQGLGEVVARLRARSLKGQVRMQVDVQYTAPYAVYVHENLQSYHSVGQAKFLEQPFRQLLSQMKQIIRNKLLNNRSLEEGLKAAGDLLLKVSQPLVPVDTGYLKSTGKVVTTGGRVKIKVVD